jgi:hypothetical protein
VLRRVVAVDLVGRLGLRLERAEAVGEAARNEDLLAVRGGERRGAPASEARGAPPQIDRDVEQGSPDRPYEFRLGRRRRLEMQPPDRSALHGMRLVILHEIGRDPKIAEDIGPVGLDEVAARVHPALRHDEQHAFELEGSDREIRHAPS